MNRLVSLSFRLLRITHKISTDSNVERKMKSTTLDSSRSRWELLSLSMDESASCKEMVINNYVYLTNLWHLFDTAAFVLLTFATLILNRITLPLDIQYYLALHMVTGLSMSGIYIFATPYKRGIHKIVRRIDEICDERTNEFLSEICAGTENFVYFVHKSVLPLDAIFFICI